jgi:multiple sugar transport system substrate-binding protein
MIRRRHLLAASAGVLAAPAIVEKVGAATAFDWKQFKGTKIEANFPKSPRADVLQKHQKEFEELTGIRVGSEQIPEQQQRPKVMMEMTSGRPSFDVVIASLHVQKRQIEKGHWMEDLRPFLKDPTLTAPDYDFGDFGGPGIAAATAPDGLQHNIPINQDLFILYYNKAMFAAKGLKVPTTYAELMTAAHTLTDKGKGIAGFVGRGIKNANLPPYTTILLGYDQETISKDGKTLLMDTPDAIAAAEYYKKLMRETAPPGVVGFNWNESQTTFSQGRAAMWIDGVGFSAPLVDPTKSKVVKDAGFAVVPAGSKGHYTSTFVDGIGIARGTRNKGGAWLYTQWATSKPLCLEMLRTGSGTPARASSYEDEGVQKSSKFPAEWFKTVNESL